MKWILPFFFLGVSLGCSSESATDLDPNAQYIVNPESLPAFEMYLASIMKNLREQGKPNPSGRYDSVQWPNYLKHKTWYLAPVNLEKISEEILGVSFSKGDNQQLALQTKKEIWIRKDFFDLMSEEDRAALMVHEFVMSIYFLKYKSFRELCTLSNEKGLSQEKCSDYEVIDRIFPAKVPQPLNTTDYQNIRRVTGYMIQHGATAPMSEIKSVFMENAFDPRLFVASNEDQKPGESVSISLSISQMKALIQESELLNVDPLHCVFWPDEKGRPCWVDFLESTKRGYVQYGFTSPDRTRLYVSGEFRENAVFDGYLGVADNDYYFFIIRDGFRASDPVGLKKRYQIFVFQQKKHNEKGKLSFKGAISVQTRLDRVEENFGTWICYYSPYITKEDPGVVALVDSKDLQRVKKVISYLNFDPLCNY